MQLVCEKDNRYSFHNIATFYQRSKSKYCIQTHCNYIIIHISHTHFRVTTICKIIKMPQIKQCTLFSKLKDKHNLCLVLGLLRLRDKFKDKGTTCPRNIAANNCEMPEDYISELGGKN